MGNGKKVFGVFCFALLMSMFFLNSVSARTYWESSDYALSWIEYNVGPIFGVFLGGGGELLFERVLLFFVLLAFIFIVLSKAKVFKNNLAVIWIVTIGVSLLATRFMENSALLKNALLPYSVLGISLGAAIPLIIYFFFVHSFEESSTLRKILWVFFIVVFLGIWADRQSELGNLSYIYFLTGIIALILLLADGTVRRVMQNEILKQQGFAQKEDAIRRIRDNMADLQESHDKKHSISDEYYYKQMRSLEKELKYWHKR